MLVLTRKVNERIVLDTSDGEVAIVVTQVRPCGRVKLGIDAPRTIVIGRDEVRHKENGHGGVHGNASMGE